MEFIVFLLTICSIVYFFGSNQNFIFYKYR
ncbi:hypothetical protein BA6E_103238 [Bacteroidales bacterium 6E]|nr:hypothetical protein BA6E_103238 [Bacteroidales bacterium 6E]